MQFFLLESLRTEQSCGWESVICWNENFWGQTEIGEVLFVLIFSIYFIFLIACIGLFVGNIAHFSHLEIVQASEILCAYFEIIIQLPFELFFIFRGRPAIVVRWNIIGWFPKIIEIHIFQLLQILFASFLESWLLRSQKFQCLLNALEVFFHFVVMASTLIGISCLNELGQGFEHFPVPPALFFAKFILEFLQKSIVFSILFFTPVTSFIVGREVIALIPVTRKVA